MSKKRFDSIDFVNELIKKGWELKDDKLTPPSKDWKLKKIKRQKRTFDHNDHINLKNKEVLHPFKSLVKKEIGIELWNEFEFCKERKFRIDFAEPFLKIAIEIDGGIWMRGKSGHSSGTGIKRDQEKTTLLSQYGWSILRFEPDECMTIYAIETIRKTIENKKER